MGFINGLAKKRPTRGPTAIPEARYQIEYALSYERAVRLLLFPPPSIDRSIGNRHSQVPSPEHHAREQLTEAARSPPSGLGPFNHTDREVSSVPEITVLLAKIRTWHDQHAQARTRPEAIYYAEALDLLDEASRQLSTVRRSFLTPTAQPAVSGRKRR